MPLLLSDSTDLLGWTLYGGKETLAGLALIVLLLIFLTGPVRRKIRWSVLFLALHLVLLAVRQLFDPDTPAESTLKFCAVFLLCCSLGLSLVLLVTSSRLSHVFFRPPPKIFLDIAHSFVYVVAFLFALGESGVRPAELFAGSALLTAVIGLSLRDTLGNLFAGLAIQAQRPFEVGDWIQFNQDSSQAGRVTEINWRATRVVTPDRVEIIVPNALLAMVPIINYSRPEALSRRRVFVHVPYGTRPQRVREILLGALDGAFGVLTNPAPSVDTKGFDDRGVLFSVKFYIGDFANRGKAESAVRDRIWYALKRHGIRIPVPPRAVRVHKTGKRAVVRRKKARIAQRLRAMKCLDFFGHLPAEALHRLAMRARTRLYAALEIIIQQGDHGEELFVLESGEAAVTVASPGEAPLEVARLNPGNFFGEMSALTGEPRRATVRASRECEVLVIGKAALAEVFASAPDVAEQVSRTIAQRQEKLLAQLSEHESPPAHAVAEHTHRLLQRIKHFFSM